MSALTKHYLWPKIHKYIHAKWNDKGRLTGVELRRIPDWVLLPALASTINCVACGALVHPFRTRGQPLRGKVPRNCYYSPTCPMDNNPACCRGKDVRDEYIAMEVELGHIQAIDVSQH